MGVEGRRWGWVTGLVVFGLVFIFSVESGVLGELTEDPLRETPLALVEDGIRIRGAIPPYDHTEQGKYVSRFENGVTAVYTLDPDLQTAMERYFKRYRVPYGVFVAMDPKTGKVLASVEYSSIDPNADRLALRATYPAASILNW
ncbi:MAG: hypothetical protein MPW14_17020 [Candidatus Manganitrophus sp.]|nr:MAG: hypothetical protein MPW14_17020 [Candidatus Manganitrophus sp.]